MTEKDDFKQIEYFRLSNNLGFLYMEEDDERLGVFKTTRRSRHYRVQGIVPPEILNQGKEAINDFARSNITQEINTQKSLRKDQNIEDKKFLEKIRYSLEFSFEGVPLIGELRTADRIDLVAKLIAPFEGFSSIHFGVGSSMSGHYILNRESPPSFTDYAIETGKGLLINTYQKKKVKITDQNLIGLYVEERIERWWNNNE